MTIPLLVVACATAPTMERPSIPPQGATWTNAVKVSGSFGVGSRQTTTSMGTASWEGISMPAFVTPAVTTHTDARGCWIGQSAGGKPLISWNPPICYRYPVAVGNSWSDTRRVTLQQAKRTIDIESRWNVEAYEEVTVPAGKISAFRISYSDSNGTERVDWYSPDLGIFVKSNVKRTSASPNGPGTLESELVSHTIRR
jgi:hypothetical protein